MKRPLLFVAVGIVIGSGIMICFSYLLALIFMSMFLIFFKILLKNKISYYIICICLVLGGINVYLIQDKVNEMTYIDDGITYPILGEIYQVKTHEKYKVYYIKNISFLDTRKSFGRGILYDFEDTSFKEGDQVVIMGTFYEIKENTNPDGFNHKLYAYSKGIYYGIESQSIRIHQSAHAKHMKLRIHNLVRLRIESYFTGPIVGLLETVLIGEGEQLDPSLKALFRRTGLAHMLAISGLHLSIVVLGFYGLIAGLKIKGREWIGIGLMLSYLVITGAQVSTLRASLMLGLFFVAQFLVRRYDSYSALSFAAIMIVLFNPYALTQAGFLLSVTAVMGIIYLGPKISSVIHPKGLIKAVWYYMAPLIGVMVMTTPVILYFFYGMSTLSVVINMIGFPFIWGLLVFGILTILMPINLVATGLAALTNGCYQLLINLAKAADLISNQYWVMGKPSIMAIVFYYFIVLLLVNPRIRNRLLATIISIKDKAKHLILVLTAVLFLLIIGRLSYNPLEIIHLDVGQGDCAVTLYQGKCFLVDTGGKVFTMSDDNVGKTVIIPFLEAQGLKELEGVFISHTDFDHVTGLMELMGTVPIKKMYLPKVYEAYPDSVSEAIKQQAILNNIKIVYMEADDGITYNDLKFTCLYPVDDNAQKNNNDNSMVLLLEKGSFNYLFTGDITEVGEGLIREVLRDLRNTRGDFIEGIKVAHHGSKYSTTPEFLELILPSVAVVSYGENNIYGHPARQTLERLDALDIKTYKTGKEGAVRIVYTGIMVYYMDSMLVDGKDYYLCKP